MAYATEAVIAKTAATIVRMLFSFFSHHSLNSRGA